MTRIEKLYAHIDKGSQSTILYFAQPTISEHHVTLDIPLDDRSARFALFLFEFLRGTEVEPVMMQLGCVVEAMIGKQSDEPGPPLFFLERSGDLQNQTVTLVRTTTQPTAVPLVFYDENDGCSPVPAMLNYTGTQGDMWLLIQQIAQAALTIDLATTK